MLEKMATYTSWKIRNAIQGVGRTIRADGSIEERVFDQVQTIAYDAPNRSDRTFENRLGRLSSDRRIQVGREVWFEEPPGAGNWKYRGTSSLDLRIGSAAESARVAGVLMGEASVWAQTRLVLGPDVPCGQRLCYTLVRERTAEERAMASPTGPFLPQPGEPALRHSVTWLVDKEGFALIATITTITYLSDGKGETSRTDYYDLGVANNIKPLVCPTPQTFTASPSCQPP